MMKAKAFVFTLIAAVTLWGGLGAASAASTVAQNHNDKIAAALAAAE